MPSATFPADSSSVDSSRLIENVGGSRTCGVGSGTCNVADGIRPGLFGLRKSSAEAILSRLVEPFAACPNFLGGNTGASLGFSFLGGKLGGPITRGSTGSSSPSATPVKSRYVPAVDKE